MVELWMAFEAVAPNEEALENSLIDHLEKLGNEPGVEIVEQEVENVKEMEDPGRGLEKGFSQVADATVEAESFETAVNLVINYGPTYVQIEGPEKIELELGEAQDSLQLVANMMSQYAEQGPGGVIISSTSGD